MKPYYQENNVIIYQKDARDMSELADESVQCVVTSPPYWGLRKYSGEQGMVWGDADCGHEWQAEYIKAGQNWEGFEWQTGGQKRSQHGEVLRRDTCSLCGAWRGAYGLEPTPEMYVEHTLVFLREIRRVLRKDGVCFLNLGDSYAGSWGAMSHDLNGKAKRTGTNERPPQSFLGGQRGEQSGKHGKELLDSSVRDFFSQNPCGECVRTLLNHNPDSYDYPSLALAVSSVLSSHSHKGQLIDHLGSSGSTSRADHNGDDTLGLCSFASFLDGVAHAAQESTKGGVSAEFPECLSAQSYWDCPSLNEIVLPSLPRSNDEVCPFWLYLLSHGILGLTESISGTLETDGASAVRIKDRVSGSSSYPYSIIPQHQPNLKPKDLCLIPFRVTLASQGFAVVGANEMLHLADWLAEARVKQDWEMVAIAENTLRIWSRWGCLDGWWVRSIIVWSKPNPMPESVTDRPTTSHEYILMLTKSQTYYWDQEAVRSPAIRAGETPGGNYAIKIAPDEVRGSDRFASGEVPAGRNIRSVWEFPTQPYPEAHFAVFPEKLPETCIKAATSEKGNCPKCGKPWVRITKEVRIKGDAYSLGGMRQEIYKREMGLSESSYFNTGEYKRQQTLGWQPQCDCGEEPIPAVVLDPFSGAGTTLYVARKLGRRAVGYDTSEDYCQLAVKRLAQGVLL